MDAFEIEDVIAAQEAGEGIYREFVRVPSLSAGMATFAVDVPDTQAPHDEDEIYYVVSGEGMIQVNGVDRAVRPGTIIYVAAHDEHHFHSVTTDLKVLVVFAPPVGSVAAARRT